MSDSERSELVDEEGSDAPAGLAEGGEVASSPAVEEAPSSAATKAADRGGDGYRASTTFLVVVTLVNLVADLWSKHWAKTTFEAIRPGDERKKVIVEGFMNFIFAKNRGGAWGLLQNEAEALRRPFFLIVSVAAIVFIVSLYRKLRPHQTALKWGLPLVLGGALGNLVDRVRYGYVVDFIDIAYYLPEWVTKIGMTPGENHWPTFNVADISICVGVVLMAVDMFTTRDEDEEPKGAVEAKPSPGKDEASVADA